MRRLARRRPGSWPPAWKSTTRPSTGTGSISLQIELSALSRQCLSRRIAYLETLGCEVAAIANSLVFDCEGEPLLIMSSGTSRANTALVGAALGGKNLKRASPEFLNQATGQAIGGAAPAGHPAPLRTLVDASLHAHDPLWVAAGTADSLVPLSYDELLTLTGATGLAIR